VAIIAEHKVRKRTVSLPLEIDAKVRTVRAELIGLAIGPGTYSDAVRWLIAKGFEHRGEIYEKRQD